MNINGEIMCWICASNPIDFVSNNESDKKYTPLENKLRKIARLKNTLSILDSQPGIEYCSEGTEQIEILRKMQYDFSREL